MTTKTDITLAPACVAAEEYTRRNPNYEKTDTELYNAFMAGVAWQAGRAAVEADRRGRMPSDEELLKVCESAGFLFHYDRYVPGSGYGLQAKAYTLENFRALLSRYINQPAASAEPCEGSCRLENGGQRCSDCGYVARFPLVEPMPAAPVAQEPVAKVVGMQRLENESSRPVPRIVALVDTLSEGTKLYAAPVAAQAQPIPDKTLRLVGVIADKIEDGTLFNAGIFRRVDLADMVRKVRSVAAQAQPVSMGRLLDAAHAAVEILDMIPDDPDAQLASVELSNAAAAVTPQAQPVVNQQMTTEQTLANTQRAIIEAAERRGYELAVSERTQDRGDAQLTEDHGGFRVDYSGLIMQSSNALVIGSREPALAGMLRQLQNHMTDLGLRWYEGDVAVVDEFLQLYCIADESREALKAARAAKGADHA